MTRRLAQSTPGSSRRSEMRSPTFTRMVLPESAGPIGVRATAVDPDETITVEVGLAPDAPPGSDVSVAGATALLPPQAAMVTADKTKRGVAVRRQHTRL